MEVTTVVLVEKFRLALGANGDVRRNEDVAAFAAAFDDLKFGERRGVGDALLQELEDDRSCGRRSFYFFAKFLQSCVRALSANLDIGAFVADIACDAKRLCRAADKRSEADALHDAEDFYSIRLP